MTHRPLPIVVAVLGLALTASACAGPSATRSADEDLLLDCRAKADEAVKSRYTGPWERAVRQCLDEAQKD